MTPWPLVERFPALASLPIAPLRRAEPSIEALSGVARALRSVLPFAFRDDLTGPGGAKTGRLELLLGAATASRADAILTGGSYGSHHVMATAIHARELGLRVFAFVQPQPPSAHARRVLEATLAAGATLIPCDASVSMHTGGDAMQRKRAELETGGLSPHVIPFGGLGPLGAIAHVDAVFRLARHAAPDKIYVAFATASTVAGILVGLALVGLRTQVVAVRVAGVERDWSSPGDWAERIAIRARAVSDRLRSAAPEMPSVQIRPGDVVVRSEALGPGYGHPTTEAAEAARCMRDAEGIALDSVYTAKACSVFFADLRSGTAGAAPLLWITGSEISPPLNGEPRDVPPALQAFLALRARRD